MRRITALRNGSCVVAGHHAIFGGDPGARYPFALLAWLIEGGEAPMMVDVGLRNVEEMNRGAAHVLAEPIVQAPDETIPAQLARRGLCPEDIGRVLLTHLHFDHVDELDRFLNAEIVVSRRGLEAATNFPEWRGSWAPAKTLEILTRTARERVRLIDDEEVCPGIRALHIGGHSKCSMAVIVETALGKVALPGDTISIDENVNPETPVGIHDDLQACREAARRLRREADIIVPSHDPSVFERFPQGVIG